MAANTITKCRSSGIRFPLRKRFSWNALAQMKAIQITVDQMCQLTRPSVILSLRIVLRWKDPNRFVWMIERRDRAWRESIVLQVICCSRIVLNYMLYEFYCFHGILNIYYICLSRVVFGLKSNVFSIFNVVCKILPIIWDLHQHWRLSLWPKTITAVHRLNILQLPFSIAKRIYIFVRRKLILRLI